MDYIDLILRVFFLSQTGIGLLGNSFSLLSIFTFHSGDRVRPSDHILKHIFLANSLVLLSKGIPQTMISFGWNNFLEDHGCKFLFYIHRVAREVCLSSTCLLSIFQAITIIPSKSRWAELKARVPKYIGPLCFLCWVVLFFWKHSGSSESDWPKEDKKHHSEQFWILFWFSSSSHHLLTCCLWL